MLNQAIAAGSTGVSARRSIRPADDLAAPPEQAFTTPAEARHPALAAPRLRISDLQAGYGGEAVARLSSLSLAAGEAALLVGRSGSGRTSLLLAIARLAEAVSGTIAVDDIDTARLTGAEADRFRKRHIGLVWQDPHLLGEVTVLDNLLLAALAAGVALDADRALALLSLVSLRDQALEPAHALDPRQAQRAGIARAMLLRPKLILVNEPTADLDDAACFEVVEHLLAAAAETGAALLIATHDQRLRGRVPTVARVEPARP